MANNSTDSAFVRRLAAAARAAWWTLLIAAIFLTAQYFTYRAATQCPIFWSWELRMIGADTETVNGLVLQYMVAMKALLLVWLMACIFLSLWVRRLRRVGDA